ncbi:MAG TPA: hypothetical protein VMB71_06395 [Acetobacteraceae bacterium]|nr:hypothetical protein [Acetobacteraceae bacterium]
MISASTLPVARMRVAPVQRAEARAVPPHAVASRAFRPTVSRGPALLETVLLILTAGLASLVIADVIAGAIQT